MVLGSAFSGSGLSALKGDFRSSCFSWAYGQNCSLCQAQEHPTPHVVEASVLQGPLFRNMSQCGSLIPSSP